MVLNNGIAPCGTMSRCCCCNMRLICAKSPYCVINSGSGSSDKKLEEIENLIQQLIQSQAQALADLETKATAAQASLNTITANIATLQNICILLGSNKHYLICWKYDSYFIIRKQYVCNDWSYYYISGIC